MLSPDSSPAKKMPNAEATRAAIKEASIRIRSSTTEAPLRIRRRRSIAFFISFTIFLIHSDVFFASLSVFLAEAIFCEAIAVCFAASIALLWATFVASAELF